MGTDLNIGHATAYAYAKSKGYTGTEEQFATELAQFAQNAQKVAEDRAAVEQLVDEFLNTTAPAVIQDVTDEGTSQVERVANAGSAQVTRVGEAGNTQIAAVASAGTTQIGLVTAEGTTQVTRVQDKGDEVIDSIPADYTALTQEVSDLNRAITYKTDKVFGGSLVSTYKTAEASKAWSVQLGTKVNSPTRAACDPVEFIPDMKTVAGSGVYNVYVLGNDEGAGHPLTALSTGFRAEFDLTGYQYKYIFINVGRSDNANITEDLTDVISLKSYSEVLPFALYQDVDQIETDIDNIGTAIRNVESDVGKYNINLFADNLVNMAVSGTTGEPLVANNARVCNASLLPLAPNVPLYINRPATGFFTPILYLFNNGIFTGTVVTNFVNGNSYNADGIRFLFFKNPNTADISAQDVVDNYIIYQEASDSLNNRVKELEGGNDYSLIAYGDSLTTGAGATDSAHTYWAVCASQLNMKNRIGFGYGGSQSKAIAFTAGGLSGYVPPNTREFPIKYADLTSDVTIAANALNGKIVIIDGTEYSIGQTGVTLYTLPNTYTPADIYKPVVIKNSRYKADVYVIWMGTNDGAMQWDIIDAMIAKLPQKNYVVMGLTRLGTDTTVEDEAKAYTKYGSHYFNTRVQIINNAFAVLGTTPTAEDQTAMSNGLMPPSLLYDNTHFNDLGYEAIGKLLALHIKSLGYTFQTT